MRKRNLVIYVVIAAVVIVVAIFVTKEITFTSHQTWVEVSNQELPKSVLDTLVQQKKNGRFDMVTLLDSNYAGKISFNFNNSHTGFFSYDYYTIEYSGKKIIAKKEYLTLPFIIFGDKIYAELYQKFAKDSLTPPHVYSTQLK